MLHIPPPDLPDDAKTKWSEIVGDHNAESLTPLDLDIIAAYARAYAEEQHALRLLGDCPNPFLLADDGKLHVNPLRSIINQARAQMQRLRRELRGKLQSNPGAMADYKARLLVEIQRRHLALADVEPFPGWSDQIEYGPIFSAAQWFNVGKDDAERMRWSRAMQELIDEVLVIESRVPGAKWSNVRLSEEGENAVAQ